MYVIRNFRVEILQWNLGFALSRPIHSLWFTKYPKWQNKREIIKEKKSTATHVKTAAKHTQKQFCVNDAIVETNKVVIYCQYLNNLGCLMQFLHLAQVDNGNTYMLLGFLYMILFFFSYQISITTLKCDFLPRFFGNKIKWSDSKHDALVVRGECLTCHSIQHVSLSTFRPLMNDGRPLFI